jgi:hypothetical protein
MFFQALPFFQKLKTKSTDACCTAGANIVGLPTEMKPQNVKYTTGTIQSFGWMLHKT